MGIAAKPLALPLLDLTRLDGAQSERAAFLVELRAAARDVGFFYLVGHGIPPALVEQLQSSARAFFALPEADKVAVEMVHSAQFRGYTRVGWERTRGEADLREQFDIGPERQPWPAAAGNPAWTRLQGPNLWASQVPAFRAALLAWQEACGAVSIRLLRAVAEALEQDPEVFRPLYAKDPHQRVKVIRYPGRHEVGGEQGVGAHKDSGFLTLLLQDSQRGLQVEGPKDDEGDGRWIAADPVPGSFVVNIGELLELASNGYLRATIHRVVTPPPGRDRLSVAFFFGASLDATVPLLSLPPHLAAEARGAASDPMNPMFREVGANYLKSRLRSHPDVARRWYSDLRTT